MSQRSDTIKKLCIKENLKIFHDTGSTKDKILEADPKLEM